MIYNIVLNRPGIQVIQGRVMDFSAKYGTVRLYLEADYPTNQVIVLHGDAVTIERMRMKTGSHIMASIVPTEETIAIYQGIRFSEPELHVNAHVIRYTGAFDFKPYKETGEDHVFCGYLGNVVPLQNGGNIIELWWNYKGVKEIRYLYSSIDLRNSLAKTSLFVAGVPKLSNNGYQIYPVRRMMPIH